MKKKLNSDENNENSKPHLYDDHKKPVTRRDFLASGLMGMSTLAFGSTAMALMSNKAWAQANCATTGAFYNGNVPFLCIDCAGGMNIAGGNAIMGLAASGFQGEVGSNFSDYRKLGISDEFHPSRSGMINTEMGLKFHSTSGIFEGMNEVLAPREGDTKDLRNYVDGVIIGAVTNDDTQTNPINTAFMAHKAGAKGDLVQLVGTANSVSGGNSVAPPDQIDLTKKPSQLTNFNASSGLLSIGNNIMGTNFLNATGPGGKDRMQKFMQLLARAGSSHRGSISSRSQALAQEINKYEQRLTGVDSVFNRFSPAELNPTTSTDTSRAIIEATYGKTLNTLTQNEQQSANIINLLTKRVVGAATISVGGGDYHDGTAMSGHNKDREIGRYIGWAFRIAAARNVPCFIHVFTDGAVIGDAAGQVDPNLQSRTVWRSDDGTRSAALMMVFHPTRQRQMVGGNDEYSNFLLQKQGGANSTRQIGYFRAGGGNVLDAHSLSNNVSQLWRAIILNYMATMVNSTDDEQVMNVAAEQFRCRFGDIPADWRNLIRFKSLVA
jgi:hypothetical protein